MDLEIWNASSFDCIIFGLVHLVGQKMNFLIRDRSMKKKRLQIEALDSWFFSKKNTGC